MPKYYLILDTETTIPAFLKDFSDNSEISLSKPLIYDIGWVIYTPDSPFIIKRNYLVKETFSLIDLAYYSDKKEEYLKMLDKGEILYESWDNIIEALSIDISIFEISAVCAYNAAFDFKKAIPFTERYVRALYSNYFDIWEKRQKEKCQKILDGTAEKYKNPTFLNPIFKIRDIEVPIVDIWGLAVDNFATKEEYKDFCLTNKYFSKYFSTSAETMYRYLNKDTDFIESHTALDDAVIETEILDKLIQETEIEPQMRSFPFRKVGKVEEFIKSRGKK